MVISFVSLFFGFDIHCGRVRIPGRRGKRRRRRGRLREGRRLLRGGAVRQGGHLDHDGLSDFGRRCGRFLFHGPAGAVAVPAMAEFAPWPDDIAEQQVTPFPCPAAQSLGQGALPGTRATAPVIRALRRAAPSEPAPRWA